MAWYWVRNAEGVDKPDGAEHDGLLVGRVVRSQNVSVAEIEQRKIVGLYATDDHNHPTHETGD